MLGGQSLGANLCRHPLLHLEHVAREWSRVVGEDDAVVVEGDSTGGVPGAVEFVDWRAPVVGLAHG